MIMQILPDIREVEDERDTMCCKSGCRADAGEEE
jgi:hypothetical protein